MVFVYLLIAKAIMRFTRRYAAKKKELLDTITVSHMSYDEIISMIKDADRKKQISQISRVNCLGSLQ